MSHIVSTKRAFILFTDAMDIVKGSHVHVNFCNTVAKSPQQKFMVVSRFLSRRFHPKSRRLFPFYFSSITLKTDLLTFGVTGAVFKIASEMRRLPAYFDNPEKLHVFCKNG